ncbi:MAG: hypothetical protein N4A64_15920 [Marinisporobacter sp.]|jgi:hypothetical protein|nr:hypothetical protein [Marinisporobacter sp.]
MDNQNKKIDDKLLNSESGCEVSNQEITISVNLDKKKIEESVNVLEQEDHNLLNSEYTIDLSHWGLQLICSFLLLLGIDYFLDKQLDNPLWFWLLMLGMNLIGLIEVVKRIRINEDKIIINGGKIIDLSNIDCIEICNIGTRKCKQLGLRFYDKEDRTLMQIISIEYIKNNDLLIDDIVKICNKKDINMIESDEIAFKYK